MIARHRECIVARWRRSVRQVPVVGRPLQKLLLPKSTSGIALRISLAGTTAMWVTAIAM